MQILKEYRVTWTIDIMAISPEVAARIALAIQRDVESTATSFDVMEWTTGKHLNVHDVITVDLDS